MFPKNGPPMKTDAHSRALLNISFRVPNKGALPPGPRHRAPLERDAPFLEPFLHSSFKIPGIPAPPSSFQVPFELKGPLRKEMPVSGALLNISSGFPVKGALPRGASHWASWLCVSVRWPPAHNSSDTELESKFSCYIWIHLFTFIFIKIHNLSNKTHSTFKHNYFFIEFIEFLWFLLSTAWRDGLA
jgi:hypothetical protein